MSVNQSCGFYLQVGIRRSIKECGDMHGVEGHVTLLDIDLIKLQPVLQATLRLWTIIIN